MIKFLAQDWWHRYKRKPSGRFFGTQIERLKRLKPHLSFKWFTFRAVLLCQFMAVYKISHLLNCRCINIAWTQLYCITVNIHTRPLYCASWSCIKLQKFPVPANWCWSCGQLTCFPLLLITADSFTHAHLRKEKKQNTGSLINLWHSEFWRKPQIQMSPVDASLASPPPSPFLLLLLPLLVVLVPTDSQTSAIQ